MARNMILTFLGTSSGGGPTRTRNCSSIVADIVGDGSLWLVDCAEGTVRQFEQQPRRANQQHLRIGRVNKIFVTHMHADHVMGIITLLRNVLFPPRIPPPNPSTFRPAPPLEIYGPAGLRQFVRTIFNLTCTRTSERYVVHELLNPGDGLTSCNLEALHPNECVGKNIVCSEDGFWHEFHSQQGAVSSIVVDAGPISHRDPCLGYVFRETGGPRRKVVILGDTYDASAIIPLAKSPNLLVHEATDAYIPPEVDPSAKRKKEVVEEKALARGHSTPVMAGQFAREVEARQLVLNHIGSRHPAPHFPYRQGDVRLSVMKEFERQASEAWGMGKAKVAYDYMRITIPVPK